MDNALVEKIRQEKAFPLIGVIGASAPTPPYRLEMGIAVGYALRGYIETAGGTVFTGGVAGVGVDTYIGVMQFCTRAAPRHGRILDDRFFALIPRYHEPSFMDSLEALLPKKPTEMPYEPPGEYAALGYLTPRGQVDCVYAGKNMEERRTYLAEIADVILVVNGGAGTLDEAHKALKEGKSIIALPYTGGAAAAIGQMKEEHISPGLTASLSRLGIIHKSIDRKLILTVGTIAEMTHRLHDVLRR